MMLFNVIDAMYICMYDKRSMKSSAIRHQISGSISGRWTATKHALILKERWIESKNITISIDVREDLVDFIVSGNRRHSTGVLVGHVNTLCFLRSPLDSKATDLQSSAA